MHFILLLINLWLRKYFMILLLRKYKEINIFLIYVFTSKMSFIKNRKSSTIGFILFAVLQNLRTNSMILLLFHINIVAEKFSLQISIV